MIRLIEELSINAFPALTTMLVNGWILRFSKGYSKRGNSVNPIYDCTIDVESNISTCDELYRNAGLDTVFKLTESTSCLHLDELLAARGYSYEAKTNILLKDIRDFHISQDTRDVLIYRELQEAWFDAFTAMNKVSTRDIQTLKSMLQSIMGRTYYAGIVRDGEIVAVGLGVAERDYVGMFDIFVHPKMRRQGLGEKIMENLIWQASQEGCHHSYLQVVDANEAAKALYKKLGYEKQYSYWYRVKKLKV